MCHKNRLNTEFLEKKKYKNLLMKLDSLAGMCTLATWRLPCGLELRPDEFCASEMALFIADVDILAGVNDNRWSIGTGITR